MALTTLQEADTQLRENLGWLSSGDSAAAALLIEAIDYILAFRPTFTSSRGTSSSWDPKHLATMRKEARDYLDATGATGASSSTGVRFTRGRTP